MSLVFEIEETPSVFSTPRCKKGKGERGRRGKGKKGKAGATWMGSRQLVGRRNHETPKPRKHETGRQTRGWPPGVERWFRDFGVSGFRDYLPSSLSHGRWGRWKDSGIAMGCGYAALGYSITYPS
jgi:hypothetical protein